jgi:mannosyltransferase
MPSTARSAQAGRTTAAPRRRARRASAFDRAIARWVGALERPEAPYLVLLGGFMALGLFLRVDGLGGQSLWFDEADAVMLARRSFGTLLANLGAAGQNGPLYTLFLHVWMLVFGTSEVAVRLPSVLAGVAAIPLIYALGRALHGPKLGLYAAGILAIAPYQHWYAREAKMYALVTCVLIASLLLLLRALRTDGRADWAAYVVVTTIALYLHVMAALILAVQAVWIVLSVQRGTKSVAQGEDGDLPRRPVTPRASFAPRPTFHAPRAYWALAALTVPYLPIALWELQFFWNGTVTWHRPIGPLDFLRVTFTKFATGVRADDGTALRGLILFGGLAVLGALPLAWKHGPWAPSALGSRRRAAFLAGLVVVPMALFYAVTLIQPLFSDRYLIVVTPAFILLVAGGLLALERLAWPLALLAMAGIVATSWVPLRDVNLATTTQKEDWRTAYERIAEHAHPNDVVIIHPGYLRTTMEYYALEDARLQTVPLVVLPTELTDGSSEDRALDLFLQRATSNFERVWLILSPDRVAQVDPLDRRGDCQADRLRDWFCYNGRLVDERELNGVWLGLYTFSAVHGSAYYPPPAIPADTPVAGGRLVYRGFSYDFAPGVSSVRPGGYVPLVLRWYFPRPKEAGLLGIRWSLLDERGAPVAGAGGSAPLMGGRPLRPWERPGEVWDYQDLRLPADLAAGRYRIVVEVVDMQRPDVALPSGKIELGWVEVR